MRWFWLACLSVGAVEDIKSRSISGKLLAVCGAAGVAAACGDGLAVHVPGLLAGLVLLAVSRITKGAVGAGDGLFLLASAWYLTAGEMWLFLLGGMAVSWVWSMTVIMGAVWSGNNFRKITLPFLVCLWPVGVWLVAG